MQFLPTKIKRISFCAIVLYTPTIGAEIPQRYLEPFPWKDEKMEKPSLSHPVFHNEATVERYLSDNSSVGNRIADYPDVIFFSFFQIEMFYIPGLSEAWGLE